MCETPKSPPGDYNLLRLRFRLRFRLLLCETPKSPPGDYNSRLLSHCSNKQRSVCETPKSPPGDYNMSVPFSTTHLMRLGVKHLNPRQGITI